MTVSCGYLLQMSVNVDKENAEDIQSVWMVSLGVCCFNVTLNKLDTQTHLFALCLLLACSSACLSVSKLVRSCSHFFV